MAYLVRTWNVFHGNAYPPGRSSHLRAMIDLAVADGPDVVCLQEVPVWALARLGGWTGYRAFGAIARHGARPSSLAGWVTRRRQSMLRSAIAGQANAVLVRADHDASALGVTQLSDRGRERRVVQVVRVAGLGVLANMHLTQQDADAAQAELERARSLAEQAAKEGEPVVLAGDLNLVAPRVDGYSAPGPGIDHVLVRGRPVDRLDVWPPERRVQNGVVLSDHAPVDALCT